MAGSRSGRNGLQASRAAVISGLLCERGGVGGRHRPQPSAHREGADRRHDHRDQGRTRPALPLTHAVRAGRAAVTGCLATFRGHARTERRRALWRSVFERWRAWHFDVNDGSEPGRDRYDRTRLCLRRLACRRAGGQGHIRPGREIRTRSARAGSRLACIRQRSDLDILPAPLTLPGYRPREGDIVGRR